MNVTAPEWKERAHALLTNWERNGGLYSGNFKEIFEVLRLAHDDDTHLNLCVDLAHENEELRDRLQELEQELGSIKNSQWESLPIEQRNELLRESLKLSG